MKREIEVRVVIEYDDNAIMDGNDYIVDAVKEGAYEALKNLCDPDFEDEDDLYNGYGFNIDADQC